MKIIFGSHLRFKLKLLVLLSVSTASYLQKGHLIFWLGKSIICLIYTKDLSDCGFMWSVNSQQTMESIWWSMGIFLRQSAYIIRLLDFWSPSQPTDEREMDNSIVKLQRQINIKRETCSSQWTLARLKQSDSLRGTLYPCNDILLKSSTEKKDYIWWQKHFQLRGTERISFLFPSNEAYTATNKLFR